MPACVVSGSNQKLFFKCVNHARGQDWRAFCVCQQRHNTVLASDSKTLAQLQNLGIGTACCLVLLPLLNALCFVIAFLPFCSDARVLLLYVWVRYCISHFRWGSRQCGGAFAPTNVVATFTYIAYSFIACARSVHDVMSRPEFNRRRHPLLLVLRVYESCWPSAIGTRQFQYLGRKRIQLYQRCCCCCCCTHHHFSNWF